MPESEIVLNLVSLTLSEEAGEIIEKLKEHTDCDSISAIAEEAFAIYLAAIEKEMRGEQLYVEGQIDALAVEGQIDPYIPFSFFS